MEENIQKYELMTIINPDLDENERTEEVGSMKKAIEELEGKIVMADEIGQRKLAYPIKKKTYGYYVVFYVELEPLKVKELEGILKLNRNCFRFLIIKPPKNYEYKGIQEKIYGAQAVEQEKEVKVEQIQPSEEQGKAETAPVKKRTRKIAKDEIKEEVKEEIKEIKAETAEDIQPTEEKEEKSAEPIKQEDKKAKKTDKEIMNDLDKALAEFIEDPSIKVK